MSLRHVHAVQDIMRARGRAKEGEHYYYFFYRSVFGIFEHCVFCRGFLFVCFLFFDHSVFGSFLYIVYFAVF